MPTAWDRAVPPTRLTFIKVFRGASPFQRIWVLQAVLAGALMLALLASAKSAQADGGFQAFLAGLWPEAKAEGVSRDVFEAAFKGMEPDLSLPDLALPGRDKDSSKGQAEFTRAPSEYLDRAYLGRLAADGRAMAKKYEAAFPKIERETGVDRYALLAIWGRETAYGTYKLPHDAVRVLATEAYVGRRKEMFRLEILAALKMLQLGVPRALMRSSWAGAVGLTQFMPTEYINYTANPDGSRLDIWNSVPDALNAAARQLAGKGWMRGQTWGYEARVPAGADCSLEGPTQERPLAEWARLGFVRAGGRPFTPEQQKLNAYLMMPAGAYGPAFLVLENFKVIRRYNTSDLYAVFVGNLADRIAGGGDFEGQWGGTAGQKTSTIQEIQTRLKALGAEVEKIDGKIGSNTRHIVGAYQKANRLKVDCWPSDGLLAHLRSVAQK